jgi:hypothetical protein
MLQILQQILSIIYAYVIVSAFYLQVQVRDKNDWNIYTRSSSVWAHNTRSNVVGTKLYLHVRKSEHQYQVCVSNPGGEDPSIQKARLPTHVSTKFIDAYRTMPP